MLTCLLRDKGHTVLSFVENNFGEGHGPIKPIPFDEWINTDKADKSFQYDINGAMTSDLVIYISPSGMDAGAEIGAAYASNIPIIGLWAKGEQLGLMRKMISSWFDHYDELLLAVELLESAKSET